MNRTTFPPLTRARDAVVGWLTSGGFRALLYLALRLSNERTKLKQEVRALRSEIEQAHIEIEKRKARA